MHSDLLFFWKAHLNYFGKPYLFFGDYLREKYSYRILKLAINSGLGCPNRNVQNPYGCIFCGEFGSASVTSDAKQSISSQMRSARDAFSRSGVATKYIAYFQAYTNTMADTARLRKLYDEALLYPDVIGLMIGTRPDMCPEPVCDLLEEYSQRCEEFWVELGIQSMHDRSLDYLRRGHNAAQSIEAVRNLAARDIDVCAHVILGIPGESWKDMMESADILSTLPIHGIKLHHLHILKGTLLEIMHRETPVKLLGLDEYISIAADFIERLRDDIIIHRIAADAPLDQLVAPKWCTLKGTIQQSLHDEFQRRSSWQGFLVKKD